MLKNGTKVKHKTKGYRGIIDGETFAKDIFTGNKDCKSQYKIKLQNQNEREIAPEEDLEVVDTINNAQILLVLDKSEREGDGTVCLFKILLKNDHDSSWIYELNQQVYNTVRSKTAFRHLQKNGPNKMVLEIRGIGRDNRCRWCRYFRTSLKKETIKKYGDDIPQTARVREEMTKMESHFDRSGREKPTRQDYENAAKFADKVLGILDGFDYEKAKVAVLKSKFYAGIAPLLRTFREYEEKYYSAMDMADEKEAVKYRILLKPENVMHYMDEEIGRVYQSLSPEDRKRLVGQTMDLQQTVYDDKMMNETWQVTFRPEGFDYSVVKKVEKAS